MGRHARSTHQNHLIGTAPYRELIGRAWHLRKAGYLGWREVIRVIVTGS